MIGYGDGDFLTKDTLWDFKVSKNDINKKITLQLLVYYVMGNHTGLALYDNMKYIGVFNPRLNKVYRYDTSKIDSLVIQRVEEEVIGY